MMSQKKCRVPALIAGWLLCATCALAGELEQVQFLKVSPQEHKAVMKSGAGKLQLVGVGDLIGGARVVEIVEGRVVLEQQGESGVETVIFRLDGKHQRMERLRSRGESAPVLTAPGTLPVDPAATGSSFSRPRQSTN